MALITTHTSSKVGFMAIFQGSGSTVQTMPDTNYADNNSINNSKHEVIQKILYLISSNILPIEHTSYTEYNSPHKPEYLTTQRQFSR